MSGQCATAGEREQAWARALHLSLKGHEDSGDWASPKGHTSVFEEKSHSQAQVLFLPCSGLTALG